jgi:hypothetical protein
MKLEGDYNAGYALIADVYRPRLGMRWTTPARNFDAATWAKKALVDEVGQLAAQFAKPVSTDQWKSSLIFTEPDPPGRDVWLASGNVSGRTMELVHHVAIDEPSQMESFRCHLTDLPPTGELSWSVFDLSCKTPAGYRLESKLLNAGDLRLTFANDSEPLTVRQIAVAHLALKTMPLEKWLEQQQLPYEKNYRLADPPSPIRFTETLHGLACQLHRRRKLWQRRLPAEIYILALHDSQRGKLIFVEADTKSSAEQFAKTVGWAEECGQ